MASSVLALLLAGAIQAADAPPPAAPPEATAPDVDPGVIDGRRRPGAQEALPPAIIQNNAGAISAPPPEAFPTDSIPLPDRWRIMTSLCPTRDGDQSIYQSFGAMREVCHSHSDPYH